MSGADVLDQLVGVGGAVWRASWQASVLAALVVAVQLIVGKRVSARWRHAMWMLVLVRLALPVVPSSPLSVFNLAPAKAPAARPPPLDLERAPVAWTTTPVADAFPPLAASPIETPSSAMPQAAQLARTSPDLRTGWPQVLALLWALGAALLALRIGWATWRVSRTLRGLTPIDDVALHDILRTTAAELRVRRLPKLLAGEGLFSPALVGFVRPRLLVPRDLLASFDPAELRLVFLHELAHLKRRDVAINWAATALAVLHWLNPVAWLVLWRLRLERELACDELVLSAASDADRRAYGHTIVKLLETFSRGSAGAAQPLPGAVGILEGKAQMKRRIVMIAQFARSSRTWTVVAATLVLTLGLVALTDAVQAEAPAKPSTRPAAQQKSIKMADGSVVATNDYQPVALDDQIKQTRQFIASYGEQRRKQMRQPTKLKAGDLVAVSIMDLVGPGVETVKTARVDGDGTINLPYVGEVKASGLSPRELEKAVGKAFRDANLVQNPMVAVSMPERGESHQMARRNQQAAAAATADAAEFVAVVPGLQLNPEYPLPMTREPDPATRAMLERKLPEVKLDDIPFADVVDFLRDTTGSNIFVNWRALEAAGIDRAAPVSMRLRDVAYQDVLALLLRDVGGGVTYKVENGVIVIDVPQRPAKAPKLTITAYDVSRLLGGGTEEQLKARLADLQRVVISTIQPESWRSGGSGVSAFDLRLIITASDDVHRDVEQLLKMLERNGGKPTTKPAPQGTPNPF